MIKRTTVSLSSPNQILNTLLSTSPLINICDDLLKHLRPLLTQGTQLRLHAVRRPRPSRNGLPPRRLLPLPDHRHRQHSAHPSSTTSTTPPNTISTALHHSHLRPRLQPAQHPLLPNRPLQRHAPPTPGHLRHPPRPNDSLPNARPRPRLRLRHLLQQPQTGHRLRPLRPGRHVRQPLAPNTRNAHAPQPDPAPGWLRVESPRETAQERGVGAADDGGAAFGPRAE